MTNANEQPETPTAAAPEERSRFYFLFRSDKGRIDAGTWGRATSLMVVTLVVMTAIWIAISPWAHRGLSERPLLDGVTIAVFAYLFIYTEVVLLASISFYNLSAKRFRDRGLKPALAGLIPFLALVTGAAHWVQPQIAEFLPEWFVWALDVLLIACIIWTGITLSSSRSVDDA